ncbi:hypothetical protein pdam_00002215 [Pocillopora damicornis]|uniref:Proteasome activator PA28 C-terminal domain-containing protein n=1 Tax=Pocillopora damicornis TaxID=46731 RepID=A0A3M6TFC5_POCDA|nr:hypothetical protein pdam_00002215 [Pocillopora damicornis]
MNNSSRGKSSLIFSFRFQAEDAVKNFFPDRVFELDKLLKSDMFDKDSIVRVQKAVNMPVYKNDTVTDAEPCNKKRKVADGHDAQIVNHSLSSFITHIPCNKYLLQVIELLKPKIQTLMEKCNTVKMWIQLLIPRIEDGNNFGVSIQDDYRQAVIELDEKEFTSLRLCCCELRNHYLSLHDTITKNLDKIKKPRTNNADSLY